MDPFYACYQMPPYLLCRERSITARHLFRYLSQAVESMILVLSKSKLYEITFIGFIFALTLECVIWTWLLSILIKHESFMFVCLYVHIFRSHQKSQQHEILAQGVIVARLGHDEARF